LRPIIEHLRRLRHQMTDTNRHGLSRHIPADVKLAIRQACGFGCVVCGSAIIEYEHIDPPFAWATAHRPENMALLCPQCHSKVTRKFLTKAAVATARANPRCLQQGFASEAFALGVRQPEIVLAGVILRNCPVPMQIHGMPLLKVQAAESPGQPFRLGGTFCNSRGQVSLQIVENEWRPLAANWDFEAVGGQLIVRDERKKVSLRVRMELPERLVVEELDMLLGGYRVIGSPETLEAFHENGSRMSFTGSIMDGCGVGISLE
jgi:hypothetical protein